MLLACLAGLSLVMAMQQRMHAQLEPAPQSSFVSPQKKGSTDAPPQDLEAASLEELNQKLVTLEREKNKEEEYRNYMQLERVGLLLTCPA
jgi:hypothetical protein